MSVDGTAPWKALLDQVPRALFIPDTIWVRDGDDFVALSKHDEPDRWAEAVAADAPVITQVDLGEVRPGERGSFPSSSSSQPSIVAEMLDVLDPQPGDSVLEIGTGTGWNAALLHRRVAPDGHVTTIESRPPARG
ncbi:hypothetical protein ACFWY9_33160 [Amycolatopsis sp. NPDC059027]|uniref:hypothetical protein n=1 Tax=unclassified Amycolatopsis TaxID=2618356 RepID=UPI00366EC4AE